MNPIILSPNDAYNQELVANVHPANWQNPTPDGPYNLVVIGAGSAGLVAAAGAAGLGAKVALIERHLLGGDCLNVGCVPSKAIIRASRMVGELRRANDFGVSIAGDVTVDFDKVMKRMRRIRSEISHHDAAERFKALGIDVFLGNGKFVSPKAIEIDGKTLHFKKAVIAVGGRPMIPPIPGLAEAGYLTNETLFDLTERPARFGIIGAGPIGSEMAQAFQRLGSQVILFNSSPQIMNKEDPEASIIVETIMRREGIELQLGTSITGVSQINGKKIIAYEKDGASLTASVDKILISTGRVPNIEGLNLEKAGVAYGKKGITVDDQLQTSNPHIFAAGDVAMKYQFTHAADAAARIVIQNALFMGRKKLSALTIPWCTYTDPEIAHVGMYPHNAEAQGIEVENYTIPMKNIDRAQADDETDGFVKIHAKKGTDKILGATIVATHAGEMINEITLAITAGLGLKTLSTVIHPYPTQAEAIKQAADAYSRTRLTPVVQKLFKKWLAFTR